MISPMSDTMSQHTFLAFLNRINKMLPIMCCHYCGFKNDSNYERQANPLQYNSIANKTAVPNYALHIFYRTQ